MTPTKGIIFYDGLCKLCSAEISHYKKQKGSDNFDFVDICDPTFNAEKYNLDPRQVHQAMHVIDPEGELHTGVDAFRAIWKFLPKYQILYDLSSNQLVRAGLKLSYSVFVKIRPYLPRKPEHDCSASPYCPTHGRK